MKTDRELYAAIDRDAIYKYRARRRRAWDWLRLCLIGRKCPAGCGKRFRLDHYQSYPPYHSRVEGDPLLLTVCEGSGTTWDWREPDAG